MVNGDQDIITRSRIISEKVERTKDEERIYDENIKEFKATYIHKTILNCNYNK